MKIDDMQKLAQFERTNTPEDYHLMRRYLMEMGIDPITSIRSWRCPPGL